MGPLASLKVLDFSTLLPGPYATLMLADLGADVLRIESPHRPDLVRELPPMVGGQSAAAGYLNRSKRSLALDLKRPEAIAVIHRLIAEYDIVLEQFRPGVMARLGLDYATLRALNPRLIYCSLTGYGQDGPYRDRPGHDINYLAVAGVSDQCRREGERPLPLGIQVADVAGGSMHAVAGILAAVVSRSQSGEGQWVDVSMCDAAFALNAFNGSSWLGGGVAPVAGNEWLNGGTHYDYYMTRDHRYMSVGSLEPAFLERLCSVLELESEMALAQSADKDDRIRFKAHVVEKFASADLADWCRRFELADACVEPVLSIDEAAEHPQLVARDMVVEVPDGVGGHQRQIGQPLRFSGSESRYAHTGCSSGAHSREVLAEFGFDDDAIAALERSGALG